jgi:elongation factor P
MVLSNQITAGMIVSINKKLYRVDTSVKVNVPKGTPFIKTKLRELATGKSVEKSFKLNQNIEDVSLVERPVEYLYLEGKDYLFLDTKTLEQVFIPQQVVGELVHYLKEGIELKASYYGDTVFALELPQFLELMVSKIEGEDEKRMLGGQSRIAVLETGARVEVPPFIEVGDIIKVDTKSGEYIQRV